MKFDFIKQHASQFAIELMCELCQVARSSYYAYLKRTNEPSKQEQANKDLLEKIKAISEKNKKRYGSLRIHKALLAQGTKCSRLLGQTAHAGSRLIRCERQEV